MLEALLTGDWSQAVRRQYIATREGREIAEHTFTAVATPEQQELFNRTVSGPEVRETLKFEGSLDSLTGATIATSGPNEINRRTGTPRWSAGRTS